MHWGGRSYLKRDKDPEAQKRLSPTHLLFSSKFLVETLENFQVVVRRKDGLGGLFYSVPLEQQTS